VSRRNAVVAVGLVLAMVAVTAVNLPDKVDSARLVTTWMRGVDRHLGDVPDGSLVFIRTDGTRDFTLLRHPFLTNPPRLDGPVLYPVDRLGENAHLMQQYPDRNAYLLHGEGGMFSQEWELTRLEIRSGSPVTLRVALTPDGDDTGMQAFATSENDQVVRAVPLTPGSTTDVDVVLASSRSDGGSGPDRLGLSAGPHQVVVGFRRPDDRERWQRRYDVIVEPDGTVSVIRPGIGEHVVQLGGDPIAVREDVSAVVADRE
jgi:hypothetical protein